MAALFCKFEAFLPQKNRGSSLFRLSSFSCSSTYFIFLFLYFVSLVNSSNSISSIVLLWFVILRYSTNTTICYLYAHLHKYSNIVLVLWQTRCGISWFMWSVIVVHLFHNVLHLHSSKLIQFVLFPAPLLWSWCFTPLNVKLNLLYLTWIYHIPWYSLFISLPLLFSHITCT